MRYARAIALSALVFLGSTFMLFTVFDRSMYSSSKHVLSLLWLPLVTAQNRTVDLTWHAPKKSWINELSAVLNGTGTHGFIFNSSVLPPGTPYGTYNWCNMPHVRATEYPKADDAYKLEYVEVVRRPKQSSYFELRPKLPPRSIDITSALPTPRTPFRKNPTHGVARMKGSSTMESL